MSNVKAALPRESDRFFERVFLKSGSLLGSSEPEPRSAV